MYSNPTGGRIKAIFFFDILSNTSVFKIIPLKLTRLPLFRDSTSIQQLALKKHQQPTVQIVTQLELTNTIPVAQLNNKLFASFIFKFRT